MQSCHDNDHDEDHDDDYGNDYDDDYDDDYDMDYDDDHDAIDWCLQTDPKLPVQSIAVHWSAQIEAQDCLQESKLCLYTPLTPLKG